MNTVAMQFIGGDSHQIDWCPIDKILTKLEDPKIDKLLESIKAGDGLTLDDEEFAQKVGKELHGHLADNLEALKKLPGADDLTKETIVFDKHTLANAIKDVEAAMGLLKDTSGVKLEEAEAPKEDEPK